MKQLLARLVAWAIGYNEPKPPTLGYLYRIYLFPATPISVSLKQYWLRSRIGFGLWFQFRRMRNSFQRRRYADAVSADHIDKVIKHNIGNLWRITRQRTERLINLLRSLQCIEPKSARILVIGPRNEAELLLFAAYGFSLENITAIDLFSVSPLIDTMDMHDMSFEDGCFDLVYSAYVLVYSDDLPRACREMVRVTRDHGLVAVAFGLSGGADATNIVGLRVLRGGLPALYEQFQGCMGPIYWQEEARRGDGIAHVTVFEIDKSGRVADSLPAETSASRTSADIP